MGAKLAAVGAVAGLVMTGGNPVGALVGGAIGAALNNPFGRVTREDKYASRHTNSMSKYAWWPTSPNNPNNPNGYVQQQLHRQRHHRHR